MNNANHKMIIVSAPSGAGKTTIVKHLLKTQLSHLYSHLKKGNYSAIS